MTQSNIQRLRNKVLMHITGLIALIAVAIALQ